jgi:diaminopimelate decarboxylase
MAGESQFGLEAEQALAIARECRSNPYVEFMGLHFYFGSQRLSSDPIVEMVQVAGRVLDSFNDANCPVDVVDLGLGCGVPYLEKDVDLNMELVGEKLRLLWSSPPWLSVRLWTEAGRALVGRSGFYVSRVLERKVRHGKVFIFLDGGLHTHNPGVGVGRFFRSNPRFLFVRRDDRYAGDSMESVDIVGNLCTSADSLGRKVAAPILSEGDLVVIPNSGAYCQTTGLWGFNSQPLFSEAMLTRDGKLNPIEPQYRVLLGIKQESRQNGN